MENLEHHHQNVEWLMKHKPHRVLAFLKAMSPAEFEKVWTFRTGEDAQASNDHMHDQVAKYGAD